MCLFSEHDISVGWNATRDLNAPKGLLGRNLAYGIKRGNLHFGQVYALPVSLQNCISQWWFFWDSSTKPMLSAKRLLGLHNQGIVSFPFFLRKNLSLSFPYIKKSLDFMWTERISKHWKKIVWKLCIRLAPGWNEELIKRHLCTDRCLRRRLLMTEPLSFL